MMDPLDDYGKPLKPRPNDIVIFLPNGHLYKDVTNDAGKRIWSYTALPYSTLDYKEYQEHYGDIATPVSKMNGNSEAAGAMVRIDGEKLRELGFGSKNMPYLFFIIRRPHDIPISVAERGAGLSGFDFYTDKLDIGYIDSNFEYFSEKLGYKGISPIVNLQYRPVSLVFAFSRGDEIRDTMDIKEFYRGIKRHEKRAMRMATEFPNITRTELNRLGLRECRDYVLTVTAGQTEGWVSGGSSDGMLDVLEHGSEVISNGLKVVVPEVIKTSVPVFAINRSSYAKYPDFYDELISRLEYGKGEIKRKYPEMFEHRVKEDVYWPISQIREERASGSLAAV